MATVMIFEGGITPKQLSQFVKLFNLEEKYKDKKKLEEKVNELNNLNQFSFDKLKKYLDD